MRWVVSNCGWIVDCCPSEVGMFVTMIVTYQYGLYDFVAAARHDNTRGKKCRSALQMDVATQRDGGTIGRIGGTDAFRLVGTLN